jgi:hypothetical protein
MISIKKVIFVILQFLGGFYLIFLGITICLANMLIGGGILACIGCVLVGRIIVCLVYANWFINLYEKYPRAFWRVLFCFTLPQLLAGIFLVSVNNLGVKILGGILLFSGVFPFLIVIFILIYASAQCFYLKICYKINNFQKRKHK